MNRFVALLLGFILLTAAGALAGCSSNGTDAGDDPGFVHIEVGSTETAAARTAWAAANPSPTPGPSPTSLPVTPYHRPTDPPTYDGDQVIAQVGSEDITLDDYRRHVRFDRYRLLYQVAKFVEKRGTGVLDLTNTDNEYVASLFVTLADSYSFGRQSQRLMVIEHIVLQEALKRGLEVDERQFEARLAEYLGLTIDANGNLPPEFDERYDEFVAGIEHYAGMTENEFRRIVRAFTLYQELEDIIGHEPGVIPQDQQQAGVEMEDVIVQTEQEAQQIADGLRDGGSLRQIMTGLGYEVPEGQSTHVVGAADSSLPANVSALIFAAAPGDVVGPVEVAGQGWYVGRVGQQVMDILAPEEVDVLRRQHFLDWMEAKMDDQSYVIDYENWVEFTPQEPLPRDVSPLLSEENFILPEPTLEPAPTSTPGA